MRGTASFGPSFQPVGCCVSLLEVLTQRCCIFLFPEWNLQKVNTDIHFGNNIVNYSFYGNYLTSDSKQKTVFFTMFAPNSGGKLLLVC